MNPNEDQTPEEILSVYLIINGPLGMSAGKIAAQTFQAHQRLAAAYASGLGTPEQRAHYEDWLASGTRTICRIAETAHIFERACRELAGITMVDEGIYGCEPNSATVHATWPLRRSELPRMASHKRNPLLTGPPITSAV